MLLFVGLTVAGRPTDLLVEDGRITRVGPHGTVQPPPATTRIDLSGRWGMPAVVDAHVHLALFPAEEALAKAGVAAAVDWGAPLDRIGRPSAPLRRIDAGPLLTAPGGYPTRSWGRGGYGLEVTDPVAAVDAVLAAGAKVVKLAMAGEPALTDAQIGAIVERAHERGVQVGAHALSAAEVARAGRLGVDLLVHTPVEPLDAATVALWKGRAVVSTLTAFSTDEAVANLGRLREGGVEVVYGTDLGNTREASIQCAEVAALGRAGLDGAAVVAAMTSVPAERFGLPLGFGVGDDASFLVLDRDPTAHPEAICRPQQVWIGGRRR